MSYSDYQSKLALGWLQGTNGGIWQRSLGAEKDLQLDIGRQAVLADIPRPDAVQAAVDDATVPDAIYADALNKIGADRVLPRALAPAVEADGAYAERLRTCWDRDDGWAFAGSHGSLLRALARAGFPTGLAAGAVIIQRTRRFSYLVGDVVTFGDHGGWTFNAQGPAYWNQFGIIFGADVVLDDVPLGAGSVDALRLDAIIKAWKPAKARFMGTRIVVSGSIWGWPFGVTWGAPGRTWGGVSRFIPAL